MFFIEAHINNKIMQVNSFKNVSDENPINNSHLLRFDGSIKKLIKLNSIRLRLLEQISYINAETESHSSLVNQLIVFFRQKALVESEHSRSLEKFLNFFQLIQCKLLKYSLEWPYQNIFKCWNVLTKETYSVSNDYNFLSEIYNVKMLLHLQNFSNIYKKYYELISETHDITLRILRNFNATFTSYTIFQKNHLSSAGKLDVIKSRYIYKHLNESSNIDIHRSMLRDLADIVISMEIGFGLMISKAILTHVNSDQEQFKIKILLRNEEDQSRFNRNQPSKHFFCQLSQEKCYDDVNFLNHQFQLQSRLLTLKKQKLHKNLEVVHDILSSFVVKSENYTESEKLNILKSSSEIDITQKSSSIKILSNPSLTAVINQITFKTNSNTCTGDNIDNKFIFNPNRCRPKLFGGSLEEYIKITNEQIPFIIKSCIRVISSYGLESQGIFRVSGSQIEIMNFRESFERGEDPLARASDSQDMNSVAGVLKLYLRELKEPLFPCKYFNFFKSLKTLDSEDDVIMELRNFFNTISKPIVIVIRYLFAFLNHLSEHAKENMMDAFNLAISFGPTLMPTPEGKKQMQYQTQLNELIKIIILNYTEVFPKDLEGPQYFKVKSNNCPR